MSKHWFVVDWSCCLGAGGEGEVYLGRSITTGELCAVKVSTSIHPAEASRQLGDELDRCRRAAGGGSVGLIAWNLEPPRPFLVFELAQAGTLADEVRQLRDEGRVYHPVSALERVAEILTSLAKVHGRGVVHRDVKPANLLRFGESFKLTDFGTACSAEPATGRSEPKPKPQPERGSADAALTELLGASELAAPEEFIGTRLYAAPEQLRGDPADQRADLYAVGCILYEMLTGRPPSSAARSRARRRYPNALVLPAVDDLLDRLLAVDPELRPANATEALDELERALLAYDDARAAWQRLALGPSPY